MLNEPKEPAVAIGLPVYNEEKHIEKTIESLINQSYKNIKIFISDNCSTDSTPTICLRLAEKDDRIQFSQNDENIGNARNFLKTIDLASANSYEYFMFARGNSMWTEGFIEKCVWVLEERFDSVLAFAATVWVDDEDILIKDKPIGFCDTSGLDAASRACSVIWGNANYIYSGVVRFSELLKYRNAAWWDMVGSGITYLLNLSFTGSFVHIEGERWMRRYKYSGESKQEKYNRYKASYKQQKWLDRKFPMARYPYHLMRSVIKSELSFSEKVKVFFVVLLNAPLKYLVSRNKAI